EVRCLDLNPFLPVGIDEQQIHFLNSFLIFCLLRRSPPSDRNEYYEIESNLKAVVNQGRDPDLLLSQKGKQIHIREWAGEILAESREIAFLLDTIEDCSLHLQATQAQIAKVEDAALTPSAKVLHRMDQMQTSYFRFAMDQSLACSDYFRGRHLSEEKLQEYRRQADKSNADREATEAGDSEDFDTFLQRMNAA
ncbi:MAG: glutamate--cysteine ligase, partial [Pseudohongiellaceae bacterium]